METVGLHKPPQLLIPWIDPQRAARGPLFHDHLLGEQAVGAQALYAAAQARFPAGGDVEVGEVFCLGNCALGPSAVLDGTLVGRLTLERLDTAAAGWTA